VAPKVLPRSDAPARLPSAEDESVTDDTPVLGNLRGIVLLADPAQLRPQGAPSSTGVTSRGEGLLGDAALHQRLAAFIGKPASFGDLQKIGSEVVRYYRESNRPVVDAQLPEQDVTGGVVQVVVVEGRAGSVIAEEQRWFKAERLVSGVRVKRGDTIRADYLLDDINWLNRNPFRRVDLLFRKGEAATETDLILKTADRFPFRPYLGFDNWGTELTGNYRLQSGFNWGNAFGQDQILSYQFSTAPDYNVFNAHSGVWTIPLPWRHVLEFYGSYSQSKPDDLDVDVNAKALQLGAAYTIPLPNFKGIKHDLVLGVEYKTSNNNLLFGGTSIFASDTVIAQGRLTYQARLADSTGVTSFQVSGYYSPGDLLSDNTDEAFEQERAFAESQYAYGRATIQRTQTLPWRATLTGTASGQVASGNLLASEQFSVGGATTVRGYEEGILNGDRGWFASLELSSPPTRVINRFKPTSLDEELKLVAFFDVGGVSNIDLLPGEDRYIGVAGVGAGIRYRINTWLNVRFDYAWKLKDIPEFDVDSSRAYVSVTISY
jgi:hemolysin activation/secretion protein